MWERQEPKLKCLPERNIGCIPLPYLHRFIPRITPKFTPASAVEEVQAAEEVQPGCKAPAVAADEDVPGTA